MGFLLLDPLLLLLITYLLARQETKLHYIKIFLICLVLAFLVQNGFYVIGFFSLIIYGAMLPVALVQFCHLRLKIALLVFGIFLAVKIGLMFLLIFLLSQ